jgi:thioredoxin reductase (NADPH)
MMTPVVGCYLAGVIASGKDANRLFIENSRGHGELIVRDILSRQRNSATAVPRPAAD